MDEVEYEDIELLGDEFHHSLVGAVFENDGTPVPATPAAGRRAVNEEGLTEDQAVDYVNEVTDKPRYFGYILWSYSRVQPRQQAAPATGALGGSMEYETAEIAARLLVWTMLILMVAEWQVPWIGGLDAA